MAQAAWEKPIAAQLTPRTGGQQRWKFLIGGGLILAAVLYLVVTGTLSGAQYFITVDQLLHSPSSYAGQTVRVSGAVIGSSIKYDDKQLLITFTIANVPTSNADLGAALHTAVTDPTSTHLSVRVENTVMPELLQNEAQAIMTGTLGADGVFHATELNLKCPSKFIQGGPSEQSITAGSGQSASTTAGT